MTTAGSGLDGVEEPCIRLRTSINLGGHYDVSPQSDEKFERDKLCFEQNSETFRSLNQIMWQIPAIAMTLTGGLWFGASIVEVKHFTYLLLSLAAIGNTGLALALHRMRFLIGEHLKKMREFHPTGFVEGEGGGLFEGRKVVVRTFQALLLLSAVISMVGIYLVYSHPPGTDT